MNIEAIDLFCGIGGLSCGLQQAGINIVAGIDNDASCKKTYEAHHQRFIHADVRNYDWGNLAGMFSKEAVRIVVGSPSCQPFSALQRKKQHRDRDLSAHMAKAIEIVRPSIFLLENVPGFAASDECQAFRHKIDALGYSSLGFVDDFADFGLPQRRKRMVIVGGKKGFSPLGIWALFNEQVTRPKTVKEAIGDLPSLAAGEQNPQDPLHRCQNLSELNLERIRTSKPGGSWRDWPEDLIVPCHRRLTGNSYGSVYGRMSWNKPSPTITTNFFSYGSGRFGHPAQDRAISLREGACLQGFPKDYEFDASLPIGKLARQVGNAVPPPIGKAFGKAIISYLKERKK